jgi:hypothetical protein
MRRSIAAAAAALATALSVLPATSSSASDGLVPAPDPDRLTRVQAEQALQRAHDVLDGVAPASAPEGGVDPTLALRDLALALPSLAPADQVEARSVLARPNTGRRKCDGHFCVHWDATGADAPSGGKTWVNQNLATLNKVWRLEVGKLGYRRPVKDGQRGGNSKVDVYLEDIGSQGYYGWCVAEVAKGKREAPSHCVLDNDYSEFRDHTPIDNLRVTAAHEFFHTVQFAYDVAEDHWLMEATSTWMEERFADGVNDNLQYLPAGQVSRPGVPLDTFNPNGAEQYGNWVFFEFLSSRFGNGVVRSIWNQAGAFPGAGKKYSTQAVTAALRHHGGFREFYGLFAAGNLTPGSAYEEGASWPKAPVAKDWTLSKDKRHAGAGLRIDHMASRSVALQPGGDLTGKRWHARISVRGPAAASNPTVVVVFHRAGGTQVTKFLGLNRQGRGATSVPFASGKISRVTVTLANASTRFACNRGTNYSCKGKSRDNNRKFHVEVSAVKR